MADGRGWHGGALDVQHCDHTSAMNRPGTWGIGGQFDASCGKSGRRQALFRQGYIGRTTCTQSDTAIKRTLIAHYYASPRVTR